MNAEAGKTALITGATSGIGQELTKLFAKDGYNLVLIARDEEKLNQLADEFRTSYGVESTVIPKDLSREDVAQEVYNEVTGRGITVNVLVNDAGVSTYGKFATETDWEREKELIHLNVLTTTHLTKLFLKDMVARNEGKILQLASLVSVVPFPLQSVYAATKAYIYNLSQSLNNELKDTNVTMTALLPNATDTNFFREAGAPPVNVEKMLDDPAMVAKAGYDALMAGETKVVPGGLMNKSFEWMAHLLPHETLSSIMRYFNTPQDESQKRSEEKTSPWVIGLGIAAAVVAGVAIVTAYNQADVLTKARYRYKAGRTKRKANSFIDEAVNTVSDAWKTAKGNDPIDNVKETLVDGWDTVKSKVKTAVV